MIRLVLLRLSAFVLTLLSASAVLFVTINVLPGSAAKAALGIDATAEAIRRFEALNGLDRPLVVQYLDWLGRILHGDFGTSFQNGVAVGPELLKRLPVTLELATLAFLVANVIAIPLGALAARRHQRAADRSVTFLATILGAVPNFWLATLLVLVFTLRLRWLPPGGFTPFGLNPLMNLKQMIMPALSLGLVSSALLIRIMRASMLEVLSTDYIRTATAKGAGGMVVIFRHALRNALIPYCNVAAVEFGFLFGSVVVIEDIFLLPGVGSFVLVGIINRDYPVLLAGALAITVFVLTVNLLVDIFSAALDPRHVKARHG
ncbi:ABC transporter permease [Labrys monachus]|uniref:Peptide/nickel transport system permease protein n=1 Tax=Labrys monachus TaxID=217067 RepID=A0ABU0FM67_9HYPH|nr:ABC transporter permease [Labrys monachus]MDQ0395462.1 peptide/nickel transport system permease protein [Labrys monachus]